MQVSKTNVAHLTSVILPFTTASLLWHPEPASISHKWRGGKRKSIKKEMKLSSSQVLHQVICDKFRWGLLAFRKYIMSTFLTQLTCCSQPCWEAQGAHHQSSVSLSSCPGLLPLACSLSQLQSSSRSFSAYWLFSPPSRRLVVPTPV